MELANEHPNKAFGYFNGQLQLMSPVSHPRAREISCLKLIALLFPVTDFQHPIVTPAGLLADHWAAKLAALGESISDLISEAMAIWEILYEFILPARRFCASFFKLGVAILESCMASEKKGRLESGPAAKAVIALVVKTLGVFSEDDAVVALVAATELVRPAVQRIIGEYSQTSLRAELDSLLKELDQICNCEAALPPLTLFEAAPPQIRSLDPIFHEIGDMSSTRRGMEMGETKRLKRSLNQERRAATRQLSRDASALQQLQNRKELKVRAVRKTEQTRVRSIMDAEKQMLRKMQTEVGGDMDTSLQSYSSTKERKKANPRMAGNAVVGQVAEAKGSKRVEKGGKAEAGTSKVGKGGATKRAKKGGATKRAKKRAG